MKNKFKNSCAHNKFYIAIFIFIIFIILMIIYYNNVSLHRNNLLEKFIEASDNKTLGDTIVPIPPIGALISSNEVLVPKIINLEDLIGSEQFKENFFPYNKSMNCIGQGGYLSILIKTNYNLYGFLCTSYGSILFNPSNNFTVNPPVKNIKDIVWAKGSTIYFSDHIMYYSFINEIKNNNSFKAKCYEQSTGGGIEFNKDNSISIGDKANIIYKKLGKNNKMNDAEIAIFEIKSINKDIITFTNTFSSELLNYFKNYAVFFFLIKFNKS